MCVQSDKAGELNAKSSKMLKATDFKFDTRVSGVSPHMIP